MLAGLKSNGTVVVAGDYAGPASGVSAWENIIAVAAGRDHVIGLRADGVVLAAGNNTSGQCDIGTWGT
jgi:alpha-tubulin suppressor-like RCC1 family protein